MTCEDFKKITSKSIFDCTRAERSAAGVHADKCLECRGWFLATIMVLKLTPQELQEARYKGEQLLQQDRQDPEYVG